MQTILNIVKFLINFSMCFDSQIENLKEQSYWNNFYKNFKVKDPSPFAKFLTEESEYLEKQCKILDVGCGNGKDTIHFLSKGYNAKGIDLSIEGILSASNFAKDCFQQVDISNYDFMISNYSDFNIYARFFLHSLSIDAENIFLKFLSQLKDKSKIFLEFRTTNDPLSKKTQDHFRRFIDYQDMKKRINDIGFEILYSKERSGFSKIETENPVLGRIIAQKINKPNGALISIMPYDSNIIYADSGLKTEYNIALYKMMNDVHNAFVKFEIPYFVWAGTLLGVIRHGGLIPWDDDLDIVIKKDDAIKYKDVTTSLIDSGYFIRKHNGNVTCDKVVFSANVENKNIFFHCDIHYVKKKISNTKIKWNTYPNEKYISFSEEEAYPLKIAKFGNFEVFIPNNPYVFLNRWLGDSWATMAKKYDHNFGNKKSDADLCKMEKEDYLAASPY